VPDDEGPADPHGGGHFCCHHFSALAAALPIEHHMLMQGVGK
jgi:hypothetical protein